VPIREYRCLECGEAFEVIQKFSDRPLQRCKKCGGQLEKLLSRAGFVLKGSGWYADGYSGGGKTAGSSTSTSGKSSAPKTPAAPGKSSGSD
jgi:putative FmdB family regulatory protein